MRPRDPMAGTRLLFWDDVVGGELRPLLDMLGVVIRGQRHGQPKDHICPDVPIGDREELARALRLRSKTNPSGGEVLMGYMGWADCRMCGDRLGTRDFFGHGFVWPELADHYVLSHDVWTPECADMLAAVRRARRAT